MSSRAQADLQEHHLRFTGQGSDYFSIWFMNLWGTLLTVGLYGPWAKVRRLKFFYRHTQIGDLGGLDFHGKPTSILLGRLLFMAYVGVSAFFSNSFIIKGGLAVLFYAALPWMVFSSIRFYVNNTTWCGVRFRFHGGPATLYVIFLVALAVLAALYFLLKQIWHMENVRTWGYVSGFLLILSLILFPLLLGCFLWAFWRYRVNNTSLGSVRFSFPVSWDVFVVRIFLAELSMAAGVLGLWGLWIGATYLLRKYNMMPDADPYPAPLGSAAFYLSVFMIFIIFFFILYSLLVVHVQNLVFSHARLGENEFRSNLTTMRWLATYATNNLLKIMSFGLYAPYAATRMAKLRVGSVSLLAGASLLDIVNAPPAQSEAIGAEMSVIDFEFGL